MRITGVNIYGYGKLENIKLMPFSNEIQGIFGQNEAGKSTLMSFIHSILFGFPTKQPNVQRYKPKTGLKYGGVVYLETTSFGAIKVERINNNSKVAGEVTVFLPDGTVGGEEILSKLFNGMDKTFFQRIYSFDIHGIQKVQTIKSADLGKYLFSSGVIGTEVITNVEQLLDKEQERYFKPNGKKPLINQKIHQLRKIHQQLINLQENHSTYNRLLAERKALEEDLIKNDREIETAQQKLQRAETKKTLLPLLIEKTFLLHKLDQLPKYEQFPIDGIKRFEQLRASIQPYEIRRYALENKKVEIDQQLQSILVNHEILAVEPVIEKLLSSKSLFEAKKEESRNLHNEIDLINQDILHHKHLVNSRENDELFLTSNTSFARKQHVQQLSREYNQLEQQKQLLDIEFQKIKDELETSEANIKGFEKECLGEEEQASLTKIVQSEHIGQNSQNELNFIENALQNYDQRIAKMTEIEKGKRKTYSYVALCGWLFCLSWLIYGAITKHFIIVGISLFLAIILYFFRIRSFSEEMMKELKAERSSLLLKKEELNAKTHMLSIDYHLIVDAQKKLAMDSQIRSMLNSERIILKQKEVSYDKVIRSFEMWEKKWFKLIEQIDLIKKEYLLPNEVVGNQLHELFLIIEQIKVLIHKRHVLNSKLTNLKEDISDYSHTLIKAASSLKMVDSDENDVLLLMKQRIEEEKEKENSVIRLQTKVIEHDEELSQITSEWNHLNGELTKLLKQAEVNTEEDFLAKGKAFEVGVECARKLAMINSQLSFHPTIDLNKESENDDELSEIIRKCTSQINSLKDNEKEIQAKIADVNFSLKKLEEGGEYSSILQTFNLEKSHFQEMYRQWAVYAVAKDMLTKTVNLYKNERLPAIMAKVEKNMSVLTNGEYIKVYAPKDVQTFIVERNDGIRFTPEELSQATAEQLYISLRFALATRIHNQERYPIMIDDSFVNFDKNRTENAFRLLNEISREHQIFFFSCHNHLQNYFINDENIMFL